MPGANKFAELLLYIARRTEGDPRCGATKLNKILFFADVAAYRKRGRSISGEMYQKIEHGPAPKRLLQTVAALEAESASAWATRDYYGHALRKLIALRDPDLSGLSAEELDLVNQVITDLWAMTATEVSDLSHRFAGWQAVEMGEEIPYSTVLVGEARALTEIETEWALEALEEFLAQAGAA